jgi:hypothetical protein
VKMLLILNYLKVCNGMKEVSIQIHNVLFKRPYSMEEEKWERQTKMV